MRPVAFALPALAVALFSLPVAAQSIPVCASIVPVSPAQGAHFLGSRPISFQWSGEPVGTASRELHLASLDGSETVIPLDGRFSDTVKVKVSDDMAWVVVFLDANGNPLCTSQPGLLSHGAGGGTAGLATAGQSSAGGGTPAKVAIYMNNGRLVIVLQNSPYTGAYTKKIASDSYDGTNEDLEGAVGLEIHGNNNENLLIGSPGKDLIYAYGSDDAINPGDGEDEVHTGYGEDFLNTNDGKLDTVYYSGDWAWGNNEVHPNFGMQGDYDNLDRPGGASTAIHE